MKSQILTWLNNYDSIRNCVCRIKRDRGRIISARKHARSVACILWTPSICLFSDNVFSVINLICSYSPALHSFTSTRRRSVFTIRQRRFLSRVPMQSSLATRNSYSLAFTKHYLSSKYNRYYNYRRRFLPCWHDVVLCVARTQSKDVRS